MTICRNLGLLPALGLALCAAPAVLHAQTEGPLKIKRQVPPPPPAPREESSTATSTRDDPSQKTYSGSARELGMGSPVGAADNGEGRPLYRRPSASGAGASSDEDGRPRLKRSSPPKAGANPAQGDNREQTAPAEQEGVAPATSDRPAVQEPVKDNSQATQRPTLKRNPTQKPIEKPAPDKP